MPPGDLFTWLVGVAAGLGSIGLVAKWLFRAALKEANKEAEKATHEADLKRVSHDAAVTSQFDLLKQSIETLRDSIRDEARDRQSAMADMEARKQHTKANHEQIMAALERKLENHSGTIGEHTRRIIRLEAVTENIDKALVKIDSGIVANGEAAKQLFASLSESHNTTFNQLAASIREMSKRDVK